MSDVEQTKPDLKEVVGFDRNSLKGAKTNDKSIRIPTTEEIEAEKKAMEEDAATKK